MRKIVVFIMVVLSLACVCFAFACGQGEQANIEVGQVKNIDMDLGTLKWKKADNAETYKIEVSFNGEIDSASTMNTNKLNQNVKKLFKKQGEYKFTITGMNGEVAGTPVDYVVNCIKLDTPNVTVSEDGSKYVWDVVDNATKYHVVDRITVPEEDEFVNYLNDVKAEDTEYNFFYPIFPGAHSVKVKAVGSYNGDTVYLESDDSADISGIEIEKYAYFTTGTTGTSDISEVVIKTGLGAEYKDKPVKYLFKTGDKWGNPVTGKGNWGRRFSVNGIDYWFVEEGESCDYRDWTRGVLPGADWVECYGYLDKDGNFALSYIDFKLDEYFAIKDIEPLDNLTYLSTKIKDASDSGPISSWDADYKDIYGVEQTTAIETEFAANSTVKVNVRFMQKNAQPLTGEGPLDKEENATLRFYEIGGVRKNFTERADIEDKEQMPYTTDWVELTCTLNDEGKLEVKWGGMHIHEYILISIVGLAD